MNSECLSCNVTSGRIKTPGGILFQNDFLTITHSVPPAQCKGFLIIQPKRHVEHIAELSEDEFESLSKAIRKASMVLSNLLNPEKIYVCSFGETVKHVHFYLIPRSSEMPASGVKVLTQILDEGKWRCGEIEATEIAIKIKEKLME